MGLNSQKKRTAAQAVFMESRLGGFKRGRRYARSHWAASSHYLVYAA